MRRPIERGGLEARAVASGERRIAVGHARARRARGRASRDRYRQSRLIGWVGRGAELIGDFEIGVGR